MRRLETTQKILDLRCVFLSLCHSRDDDPLPLHVVLRLQHHDARRDAVDLRGGEECHREARARARRARRAREAHVVAHAVARHDAAGIRDRDDLDQVAERELVRREAALGRLLGALVEIAPVNSGEVSGGFGR